jgi:hypothetical protein
MENVIELAVQDMHSSCSEPSTRAVSRVRPVIPAVAFADVQGTTVSFAARTRALALGWTTPTMDLGYGVPQTDDTNKALSSGYQTWSPPV